MKESTIISKLMIDGRSGKYKIEDSEIFYKDIEDYRNMPDPAKCDETYAEWLAYRKSKDLISKNGGIKING